jgi:hypothetical protein
VLPPFINIYRGSIYFQRRLRKEKKERKDKRGENGNICFLSFFSFERRGEMKWPFLDCYSRRVTLLILLLTCGQEWGNSGLRRTWPMAGVGI